MLVSTRFPLRCGAACAVAVLYATSGLLHAQGISGLEGTKADPIVVLPTLRAEWGLNLAAAAGDERVGDELTEGLTDPGAASAALVARLRRGVKRIDLRRFAEEDRAAVKVAAFVAENRIIAAVDGLSRDTHTAEAARQAVRVAFSEYLATLEALIGSD